jgi:hypothetical protein
LISSPENALLKIQVIVRIELFELLLVFFGAFVEEFQYSLGQNRSHFPINPSILFAEIEISQLEYKIPYEIAILKQFTRQIQWYVFTIDNA